jgi:hypothetical protein
MPILRQLFEYHPVIGYRFTPNLKARIPHESGGYLVRANNSGFRCNHDFVTRKRPGLSRILLFGDSFTAGDGVSNEHRYGDLLEKKISNLEVYNFGLPGTGTGQQYLVYKEYATEIEHDLLIIGVYVENIERVVAHYRYYRNYGHEDKVEWVIYAKPYFELVNGELVLKNVPLCREPISEEDLPEDERGSIDRVVRFHELRNLLSKTKTRNLARKIISWELYTKVEKLAEKITGSEEPYSGYNSPSNPKWLLMRAILEEWISNHPQPVLLMPIPLHFYIEEMRDPPDYQARFCDVAEVLENCTLHDPLPDLLKYSLEERRNFRFKVDGHFCPQGHLALANSIAPVVEYLLKR